MTTAKREDVLYSDIRRNIRNALDLEYAIRASELASSEGMRRLQQLDQAIRDAWRRLGASEAEIDGESLTDYAWDKLQLGFVATRRHTRLDNPALLRLIERGLSEVLVNIGPLFNAQAVPATRFYRICDLLSGNDMVKAIQLAKQGRSTSAKYTKNDNVPFEEFRLRLREPIHIHPAFRYGIRSENGKTIFSLEVDLAGTFDLFEWKRQVNEFQYQYALHRGDAALKSGRATHDLIQDFLQKEHDGDQSETEIPGFASLLGMLSGLLAWDRYKREGKTLTSAIDELISLTAMGEDNLRYHYRNAAEKIEDVAQRFRGAGG